MWGGEVCDKKSEVWTISERKRLCWSKLFVDQHNYSFFLHSNSPKLNKTCTSHLIFFLPIVVSTALSASLSRRVLSDSILVIWSRRLRDAKSAMLRRVWFGHDTTLPSRPRHPRVYHAQCDYKIWRRLKMQRADSKNLSQLTACVLLDYSTSGARSVKENVLSASLREQRKCGFTPFTFEWLFGRGQESFKEYNNLSFVSRAKFKTLTVKQGSFALFFLFPRFR